MKSRKRTIQRRTEGGQAYFRLLGLNRGECRVQVIRSAAEATSYSLTTDEPKMQSVSADDRRTRIAIATYRLLDPRERKDLYERVQLAYPIDRDDQEVPAVAPTALIDKMVFVDPVPPNKGMANESVPLMGKPVIRRAIQSEVHPVELTIDEKRELVRMLRESDESRIRGLSPLGWIKSRLGM